MDCLHLTTEVDPFTALCSLPYDGDLSLGDLGFNRGSLFIYLRAFAMRYHLKLMPRYTYHLAAGQAHLKRGCSSDHEHNLLWELVGNIVLNERWTDSVEAVHCTLGGCLTRSGNSPVHVGRGFPTGTGFSLTAPQHNRRY